MWRNKGIIMTKLYPIGTQLITRRRSQAALMEELFGEDDFSSYIPVPETYTDESETVAASFAMKWRPFFYSYADKWRVTVTEDNQLWLSPLIMVGDYVHFKKAKFGFEVSRIIDDEVFQSDVCQPRGIWYASIEDEPKIISRIYPNGLRAPLIEWDEVILPTDQTPDTHLAP
jgi:hypothetical protein